MALNTTSPLFDHFKIKGQQLCNSNKDLPLKISLINSSDGVERQISSCVTSLN